MTREDFIGARKTSGPACIVHFGLVLWGCYTLAKVLENKDVRDSNNDNFSELYTLILASSIGSIVTFTYGLVRWCHLFFHNIKRTHIGVDILYYLANVFGFMTFIWACNLHIRLEDDNASHSEFSFLYHILTATIIIYTLVYIGVFFNVCYSLYFKYLVKDKYVRQDNRTPIQRKRDAVQLAISQSNREMVPKGMSINRPKDDDGIDLELGQNQPM